MQRSQIVKILIVVLVVFNLVQWWPEGSADDKAESWQEIQVSQLKVNAVNLDNNRYQNTRNLFYIKKNTLTIKAEKITIPIKKYSHSGLTGIRLVGVIFKSKYYEALLIKGEDQFKVRVNNYVTRRYKVKHINIKSIKLKDMQTGQMHKILLSDDESKLKK